MKFTVTADIFDGADRAAQVLADPDFLTSTESEAPIGHPTLVTHDTSGDMVRIAIRWRFTGDLNSAARAILDPAKLTWIQESRHDLRTRRTEFTIVPDNYADRFSCRGSYVVETGVDPGSAMLRAEGDVRVRVLLVGGQVERVLVDGLRQVLEAQADAIPDWKP